MQDNILFNNIMVQNSLYHLINNIIHVQLITYSAHFIYRFITLNTILYNLTIACLIRLRKKL